MEDRPNTQHFTRQLTLPSADDDQELHRCGTCHGELVQPVDWSPLGKSYWQVTLRCPNCEWSGTGVFPQEVVERFDRELDRATELVIAELDRLGLESMAQDIPGFVAALADDHILPADF
jgi:hypothetical protein